MINFFKDFLLNIFFIFSPLTVYPYLYRSQRDVFKYRVVIALFFTLAIAASMLFPVNFNGLVYDFRSIPLLIGSLYGGIYVSMVLYAATIVCRVIIGSPYNSSAKWLLPSLMKYEIRLQLCAGSSN
ncbi:LytS/YhcK type 5TM receptor domain-containing protein [Bacillus sp. 3255]|uniref:LytS/YhcK type 5TM receptor domain-containing protein n=1 Tax=Bacillus sp. 3255 TaxID=2817904 RepID=UPI00285EA979|nr:LytS/YhcK type 5TM receptor domain-containing protein [Bacillus sp. 3255]MDR6879753.1 LytS/YehU family sensor histidine kinase [Bacillus sp. 3255]